MQIGLLGKANVGKSTFFSAATETGVPAGNFPFTTIGPNVGVAHVTAECPCRHFGVSHENPQCRGGTRHIPVKLIDVAGLVPGAHEGRGLGNRFLDDARQASALIHVVDIAGATDIQGQPVQPGTHDPFQDIEFVHDEFDMWFLDILKRDWDRITREIDQRRAKLPDGIATRFTGLGIREFEIRDVLQGLGLASKNPREWSGSDLLEFARHLRRATKPIIIAANKADLCGDLEIITKIRAAPAVPCSAEAELLLKKASKAGLLEYAPGGSEFSVRGQPSPQQQKALDMVDAVLSKIHSTGIQKALDRAVFELLGCIAAYPVEDEARLADKSGHVLPDAKLMPGGSTARDLAQMVHADIAAGFLHAIDCKTRQRIGGDHKLRHGDVIKIVSTQSRG